MRTILRRLIFTLLVFVTLIALLYAEEDWRGARAWNAVLRDLHDSGETTSIVELIPPAPAIADLSKTAEFANEFPGVAEIRLPNVSGKIPPLASIAPSRVIDLSAWQRYYGQKSNSPAADVLAALSKFDSEFRRVDDALAIPGAYFPVNYDQLFATWLQSAETDLSVCRVLQLRGLARLAAGQREGAKEDFLFRFRLEEPMYHRQFLIDLLMREASHMMMMPLLWQGLHEHAWTQADLDEMKQTLCQRDFLTQFHAAMRVERLGQFQVVRFASMKPVLAGMQDPNPKVRMLSKYYDFWPSGWFQQDWAAIGRMDTRILAGLDLKEGTLSRTAIPPEQISGNRSVPEVFYSELAPVMYNSATRTVQAETYRRFACIACELERHRLLQGAYPDRLEELDLQPVLTREVLNQKPFSYQNLGKTYRLYSTGWNEEDEGGRQDSTVITDHDWSWPSP